LIPTFKKGTISGPRSGVSYSGVFGDPVAIARAATRMCRPHRHGTTPAQRALICTTLGIRSRQAQRASIGTTRIW